MQIINDLGIDVSAKTLAVCIQRGKRRYRVATFDNDPAGHGKLIGWATKSGRHARVGVEATGVYSLDLSLALHRHPKTDVMVINPRASRSFAQAMMKRAKTDPVDAEVILEFIQRMPFVTWQSPPDQILQLQAITRRVHQLKIELNREENRLHADRHRRLLGHTITEDLQVHIEQLQQRIAHMEAQGRQLVAGQPDLETKLQRLLSVTGIGETSALRILAEVLVLPDDLQANQWVAQAGLDPRPRESGTSVHRPRFISKAGNKYLRAALFYPAMVACRHQENVEGFYQKLVAAGKKKRQAIVAVMRKLLRCLWAMLKYDRDFEGDKFYVLV